jgi:hypothetical protein
MLPGVWVEPRAGSLSSVCEPPSVGMGQDEVLAIALTPNRQRAPPVDPGSS